MKYKDLLNQIDDMTEAQLDQDVVLLFEGQWVFPNVLAVVKNDFTDPSEDGFQQYQTILI